MTANFDNVNVEILDPHELTKSMKVNKLNHILIGLFLFQKNFTKKLLTWSKIDFKKFVVSIYLPKQKSFLV